MSFFRSIMRARPIGLHRHFHVLSMRTAIHQDTGRYVTIDDIWEKIRSCYNIEALENLVRSQLVVVALKKHPPNPPDRSFFHSFFISFCLKCRTPRDSNRPAPHIPHRAPSTRPPPRITYPCTHTSAKSSPCHTTKPSTRSSPPAACATRPPQPHPPLLPPRRHRRLHPPQKEGAEGGGGGEGEQDVEEGERDSEELRGPARATLARRATAVRSLWRAETRAWRRRPRGASTRIRMGAPTMVTMRRSRWQLLRVRLASLFPNVRLSLLGAESLFPSTICKARKRAW